MQTTRSRCSIPKPTRLLWLALVCLLAGCGTIPTVPLFVAPKTNPLPTPIHQIESLPTLLPTATLENTPTPSISATAIPGITLLEPGYPRISEQMAENLRSGQRAYSIQTGPNSEIEFLLYVPTSFDASRPWPFILYLHSSLEKGADLSKLRERALPKKLDQETDFPFLVVSPQIPNEFWYYHVDMLETLMRSLEAVLPIDPQREYLTGFSMGGYGTWAYAYHYPKRFAAVAPVAGSLDEGGPFSVPDNFCRMKSVPVWAFHGELDANVSPAEDRALVLALQKCGGEATFTQYPQVYHLRAGELAYADPALYDWFLAHKRP